VAEYSDGKRSSKANLLKEIGRYSAIGLEMVFAVGIGAAVGVMLDKYLKTSPWLTLLFIILGSIAGFRGLFRLIK
jgi:ATP synthase protein I